MNTSPSRSTLFLALLSSPLIACSGGGGSSDPAPSGSQPAQARTSQTNLLVGSLGDAGLFALSATISEMRLHERDGSRTENLLPEGADVELVSLAGAGSWLAQSDVPYGTYGQMEVVFGSMAMPAMDASGSRVAVQMSQDTWLIELDQELTVDGSGIDQLLLEIDLSGSLSDPSSSNGQGSGGPLLFEVDGSVSLNAPTLINQFQGTLRSASAFHRMLVLDANLLLGSSNGFVDVLLDEKTSLFDEANLPFSDPDAFFASLRNGLSMLSVRGTLLEDGLLLASRIEIVGQVDETSDRAVEIEGMVLYTDLDAGFFVLLIRQVEDGRELAGRVLGALGNPSSIDVAIDAGTRFEGPNGKMLPGDQLEAGQRVHVEFREFVSSPFPAARVRFENLDSCISGTIIETADLPDSIVISVADSYPQGSRDRDDDDDDDDDDYDDDDTRPTRAIRVDLTNASIHLNLRGKPALRAGQLINGLRVQVCGQRSTRDAGSVFEANSVAVKPGHLIKGIVSRADAQRARFALSSAKIVQAFGDSVSGAPLSVELNPAVRFTKDAKTQAEFFRLFAGLQDDQALEVKIKGIGTDTLEEIAAYEIKSKQIKLK